MNANHAVTRIASLVSQGKVDKAEKELIGYVQQPWLGLATTRELKDELAARGPDSPDDYKTANNGN